MLIATLAGILILLASMASVELGLSVAIIEIVLGVVGGNLLGLQAGRLVGMVDRQSVLRVIGSEG